MLAMYLPKVFGAAPSNFANYRIGRMKSANLQYQSDHLCWYSHLKQQRSIMFTTSECTIWNWISYTGKGKVRNFSTDPRFLFAYIFIYKCSIGHSWFLRPDSLSMCFVDQTLSRIKMAVCFKTPVASSNVDMHAEISRNRCTKTPRPN